MTTRHVTIRAAISLVLAVAFTLAACASAAPGSRTDGRGRYRGGGGSGTATEDPAMTDTDVGEIPSGRTDNDMGVAGQSAPVTPVAPVAHGAPAEGEECGGFELEVEKVPGNLLIVFDGSNTMGEAYVATSTPKWQVAQDALQTAIAPVAGDLFAGAIFYPTQDGGCVVAPIASAPQIPITDGAAFLAAWDAFFAGFATMGSSPLVLAVQAADAALADPFPRPGPRALVILTDGVAVSCGDPGAVIAPIAAMQARGIDTYVVGLPGSADPAENPALLTMMAQAGGTGDYVAPANAAALQAEFAKIASTAVADCAFALDPPPPDTTDVHLFVTGTAPDAKPEEVTLGADGWSLSADGTAASLEGATCDAAKAGEYGKVQFIFGCPEAVIDVE
jgi:hypothetical protein